MLWKDLSPFSVYRSQLGVSNNGDAHWSRFEHSVFKDTACKCVSSFPPCFLRGQHYEVDEGVVLLVKAQTPALQQHSRVVALGDSSLPVSTDLQNERVSSPCLHLSASHVVCISSNQSSQPEVDL